MIFPHLWGIVAEGGIAQNESSELDVYLMALYSESQAAPPPNLLRRQASVRILVAEDPFVGTFLRTVLQKHGHKVVTSDAVRATELLREGAIAADVVITNQPDAFLEFAGTQPILYIAASPDAGLASQFAICRVLRKPFRNEELLETVEQLAGSVVP